MEAIEMRKYLDGMTVDELVAEFPYVETMMEAVRIDADGSLTLAETLGRLPEEALTDFGWTKNRFAREVVDFIEDYGLAGKAARPIVDSITIMGDTSKTGEPEDLDITVERGEIVCVVGPTGAGKSRLLEDIECMAQGDTPTGRRILINGEAPAEDVRCDLDNKLVAQITQNMNFVLDLTVGEFIGMHASSRDISDGGLVDRIISCANRLSGEEFSADTPVTQLSGGQSRALMTADTALLSESPIVLIDEIENAGIDRAEALELLIGEGKIVLLSTHDPILALSGARRLVINNGAVVKTIGKSEAEAENLAFLEYLDDFLLGLRDEIRRGSTLDVDLQGRFEDGLKALAQAAEERSAK